MRKVFLVFTLLCVVVQNCSATEEASPSSGVRVTSRADHSSDEYRTEWGLGVATSTDSQSKGENHFLYVGVTTYHKDESMPRWNVKIYLQNEELKNFLPILFKDGVPVILGAVAGVGLVGILTTLSGPSGIKIIGESAMVGAAGTGRALAVAAGGTLVALEGATLAAGAAGGATMFSAGATAGGALLTTGGGATFATAAAAAFTLPVVAGAVIAGGAIGAGVGWAKSEWDDRKDRRCRIVMAHTIGERSKKEEASFFETIDVKMNGEDGNTLVRVVPFSVPIIEKKDDTKSEAVDWSPLTPPSEDSYIFFASLEKPILHVVDIYKSLLTLAVHTETGKASLPLIFQVKGISKDPSKYVRNWNSFAILASSRCFGLPLAVDPRLEEYIDDRKLRERWSDALCPAYDTVVERILIAYGEIKRRIPGFGMNRDYVAYYGEHLSTWYKTSGISKALASIPEERIPESSGSGGGTAVGTAVA